VSVETGSNPETMKYQPLQRQRWPDGVVRTSILEVTEGEKAITEIAF
jgi:hypothetical protein